MNLRNTKIGARLLLTTAGALGLMIVFVAIGLVNLARVGEMGHRIVGEQGRDIRLADEMRQRGLLIGRDVRTALLRDDPVKVAEEKQKVDGAFAQYLVAESELEKLSVGEKEQAILHSAIAARKLAQDSLGRVFAQLSQGQGKEARELFFAETRDALQKWLDPIGEFVTLQESRQKEALVSIDQLRADTEKTMLALILVAAVIMVAAGIYVTRSINRPLQRAVGIADAIAGGRLDNEIAIDGGDETTELMKALQTMQRKLLDRITADKCIADENARIRNALDCATAKVRICDPDGRILYVNRSLLRAVKLTEEAIRERIPDFTAETMTGRNIGILYDDSGAALQALRNLRSERRTMMGIGGRKYLVITNPILDERGELLGTVGEWVDQTEELRAQEEISAIVDAARYGDLSRRIDPADKSGFFRTLAEGVNQLLETTQQALQNTTAMLAAVAEGDLTRSIAEDYKGVFGQLRDEANTTVKRLCELVGSIQEATEAINTAAREIAAGNADLSGRTEQQAANLEETASSMEELNATVKQNALNARQASDLAKGSNVVAGRGGEIVAQVVATMGAIHEGSKKIADIIGVIDSIAFQTNILALNAAVEAARAGEQGRGFAVVAGEVRNLAQRSAQAAKEIKSLIAASVDKVEAGVRLAHDAGRTMEDVVGSVKQVAGLLTDISEASREQASGIEQVTQAVGQMDEVTQQNAALVEQAAAAAESLEDQARSLAQAVARFRLTEQRLLQRPPKALAASRPRRKPVLSVLPAAADGVDDEWAEF